MLYNIAYTDINLLIVTGVDRGDTRKYLEWLRDREYSKLSAKGISLPDSYKEIAESLTYAFLPKASLKDLAVCIYNTSYVRSQKEIEPPAKPVLSENLRTNPFIPAATLPQKPLLFLL
jgi:hypothetical protein